MQWNYMRSEFLKSTSELSIRDMKKRFQSLPQQSDEIENSSLHVNIVEKLNKKIQDQGLSDIGCFEKDLVFGYAGAKELINMLNTKEDTTIENKLHRNQNTDKSQSII